MHEKAPRICRSAGVRLKAYLTLIPQRESQVQVEIPAIKRDDAQPEGKNPGRKQYTL
jgi:hypothetical protein